MLLAPTKIEIISKLSNFYNKKERHHIGCLSNNFYAAP